jgi:hypothetical protein
MIEFVFFIVFLVVIGPVISIMGYLMYDLYRDLTLGKAI